jgi:hypothetical protein
LTKAYEPFPNINPVTSMRIVGAYNHFYTAITGVNIIYKPNCSITEKKAELSRNEKILCKKSR